MIECEDCGFSGISIRVNSHSCSEQFKSIIRGQREENFNLVKETKKLTKEVSNIPVLVEEKNILLHEVESLKAKVERMNEKCKVIN